MTADAWNLDTREIPWWLVLLEGIASVILAILLFAAPGATLLIIITLTGLYWLISGIFHLVGIFMDRTAWGWKLVIGILGIIAGILVIQHPLWSAALLPTTAAIILGIQGIIAGGIHVILAFKGGGWGRGILGVLSIVFGLLLLFNPLLSGAILVFVLGGFALVGGILAIILAFRVRSA